MTSVTATTTVASAYEEHRREVWGVGREVRGVGRKAVDWEAAWASRKSRECMGCTGLKSKIMTYMKAPRIGHPQSERVLRNVLKVDACAGLDGQTVSHHRQGRVRVISDLREGK